MYTYDEAAQTFLPELLASEAAIVERARRLLDVAHPVAAVVRYGGAEVVAMIYFYADRDALDAATTDPSSNDWATAAATVRMDATGACFLE